MENIRKTFTYDLPDDQYHQTDDLKLTGTLEYVGPAKIYAVVDENTNKLVNFQINKDQFDTFDDADDGMYAVEIDCDKNPLLCAIHDGMIDPDSITDEVIEEIPNNGYPYSRPNPPLPDHTYEILEIEYDPANSKFKTPYPWKQPWVTWEDKLAWRNTELARTDKKLSDDLPTDLYNSMAEWRQFLRDMPELFGAAWTVTITDAGTGYSVDDVILISDPAFKVDGTIKDIKCTVKSVGESGEILSLKKENTLALEHKEPATHSNVYHTTNSSGSGAKFNLSKLKHVDPWKVHEPKSPVK